MNITEELSAARSRRRALEFGEVLGFPDVLAPFTAWGWSGKRDLRELHLDDLAGIPFLDGITGVEQYLHRARLRARDGDAFVTTTAATPGYERYNRGIGLGNAAHFVVGSTDVSASLATAVVEAGADVEAWCQGEPFVIHPFMGIEAVWDVAKSLSRRDRRVEVLAPPPPVTWVANDKERFDGLVEAVLGRKWLVPTFSETNGPALTRRLLELSEDHGRVALKRLRCASAMGNLVLNSREIRGTPARLQDTVSDFLRRTRWDGVEPVLAVAWLDASCSPSTQLWIPRAETGSPRVEGVYDQILDGPEQVFVGSRPSQLPDAVQVRLREAALAVGSGLQALGYVGRCSFDHLVIGDPMHEPRLVFTECNGRWGGTSTPMNLMDRLFPEGRPPYRAQDFVHESLVGVHFEELLERIGDAVFDPQTGSGRYILYNVGPLAAFGKFDVIAWATTQTEAEAALEEDLPQRLLR